MPCLMIVQAKLNGQNREGMQRYQAEGAPLLKQHGGRAIGAGKPGMLEGELGFPFVIVNEFPTREAAETFYNSPEYTEVKQHREGTGDYAIFLIDTK